MQKCLCNFINLVKFLCIKLQKQVFKKSLNSTSPYTTDNQRFLFSYNFSQINNKTLESIANNFISCVSPTTEAWIKLSAFLQFSQDVANILSLFNLEEVGGSHRIKEIQKADVTCYNNRNLLSKLFVDCKCYKIFHFTLLSS